MSDPLIAAIARDLAHAMMARAKSRSPEDQKQVLALQTALVAEVLQEGHESPKSDISMEPGGEK